MVLTDLGAEVVGPAHDITSALQLVASEAIDYAFLELDLGPRSSLPIARRLLERKIPFSYLCTNRHPSLPPGFESVAIVTKPWRTSDIKTAIGHALKSKK